MPLWTMIGIERYMQCVRIVWSGDSLTQPLSEALVLNVCFWCLITPFASATCEIHNEEDAGVHHICRRCRHLCCHSCHVSIPREQISQLFTHSDQSLTLCVCDTDSKVEWSDQIFLSKQKINKKCSLIVVTIRSITVVVSCIYVKY